MTGPQAKPKTSHSFRLRGIGANAYESKDEAGRACILFVLDSMGAAGRGYQGLELRFSPACIVRIGKNKETRDAAILQCRDSTYEPQFLALRVAVKDLLEADPTALKSSDAVAGFVDAFARAFQRVRQPLERDAELGLWGELQILSMMPNLDRAVEAWQGPKRYLVDFSRKDTDIEVKTSTRGHLHRIKHTQTLPPPAPATHRYYASIYATTDLASGTGVHETVSAIRKKVQNKLAFDNKLAEYGYEKNPAIAYPGLWTVVAIKFVSQANLPVLPDIPDEITEMDYTLDMRDLPQIPGTDRDAALARIAS